MTVNGVELEFCGYCRKCRHPNLILDELTYDDGSGGTIKTYNIRCINQDRCDEWNELIKQAGHFVRT